MEGFEISIFQKIVKNILYYGGYENRRAKKSGWNSAYTQLTYMIFGMTKDADPIYYCTKNQMRRLSADGDMVTLSCNEQKISYLRLHTTYSVGPTPLIFGTVMDMVSKIHWKLAKKNNPETIHDLL